MEKDWLRAPCVIKVGTAVSIAVWYAVQGLERRDRREVAPLEERA